MILFNESSNKDLLQVNFRVWVAWNFWILLLLCYWDKFFVIWFTSIRSSSIRTIIMFFAIISGLGRSKIRKITKSDAWLWMFSDAMCNPKHFFQSMISASNDGCYGVFSSCDALHEISLISKEVSVGLACCWKVFVNPFIRTFSFRKSVVKIWCTNIFTHPIALLDWSLFWPKSTKKKYANV
jgi:hypothetical protein